MLDEYPLLTFESLSYISVIDSLCPCEYTRAHVASGECWLLMSLLNI